MQKSLDLPDPATGLLQLGVALAGSLGFLAIVLLLLLTLRGRGDRLVAWLLPTFRWVDARLAKDVARWWGLDRTVRWQRWGHLIGVTLLLALLGALAPAVVAVPALAFAILGVMAVFRRWSWDEEDRAKDLRGANKRIAGSEDYNDELILALAAIFLIGPLLIWRLTGLAFFVPLGETGLVSFLVYVVSETLESLPIVGNVEVFGYENPSGLAISPLSGGSTAFVLRMLLDLLVIGGLIRMFSVARRIQLREDLRREDEAVASGDDARAFEAMEQFMLMTVQGQGAGSERLQLIAKPGPEDPPQPMRRRLQAAWLIERAISEGAPGRDAFRSFLSDAYYDMTFATDLKDSRLAPSVHWLAATSWHQAARRLVGIPQARALDRAIEHVKHSLQTQDSHTGSPSFLPAPDPALQNVTTDRAVEMELLGHLLRSRGELAHHEAAIPFYNEAAVVLEEALVSLGDEATTVRRAGLLGEKAAVLARIGESAEGLEGSVALIDSSELFDKALALLSGVAEDEEEYVSLLTGKGSVQKMLGDRAGAAEDALGHYQSALELADQVWDYSRERADSFSSEFLHQMVVRSRIHGAHALLAISERLSSDREQRDRNLSVALAAYTEAAEIAEHVQLWPDWFVANDGQRTVLEWVISSCDGRIDETSVGHSIELAVLTKMALQRRDREKDPLEWARAAVKLARASGEVLRQTDNDWFARDAIDGAFQAAALLQEMGMADAAQVAQQDAERLQAALVPRPDPPAADEGRESTDGAS